MTPRTLAILLAATACSSVVMAQQVREADPSGLMAGEIVVTAQKRAERLIEVPLSISAVSGEQLTSAGINSTIELQQAAPGIMTVSNGIGFIPSIRGVQSTGTSPGDEGNVAIYLDDVSLGSPLAGFFDLADIERIEVLKGPQGTLFGRNATGGAIRIITRRPSFTPTGSLSLDYGLRYDELRLGGYLSGPLLADRVAASLSVAYRKGDGYIRGIGPNEGRHYGGSDNYLVRGKLLMRPADNFEVLIAGDVSSTKNDLAFSTGVADGGNPYPVEGSIANGPYTFAGSTQPKIRAKGKGLSVDLNWEPGADITVRSITAYREVEVDSQADVDRTNLPISSAQIKQYQDSFSQEFNITGPADRPISWILGSYYYHSRAGNPYFRFALGDSPGGTVLLDFTNKVTSEAISGFGEITVNPVSRLFLTGGLRYNSESKHFIYRDIASLGDLMTTNARKRWKSTVYRAVARYELANDASIYASFSNGFKSGVYNAYSYLDAPVDPENIRAVEVGAKAQLGSFTLTAAAFSYDYDDLQLSAYTTVNGLVLVTLTNAASAKMRGLEFTADGQIVKGLSIGTGISWQPTAKYGKYLNAQVTAPIPGAVGPEIAEVVVPFDATGSRMVRSPKVTANFRATYETPLWGGDFSGTASLYYNSGFYWQPGYLTHEKDYTVVNMRLSWTDSRRITYSVWGNNLTDAEYSTDRNAQTLGGDSVSLPPRREFGLGLGLQF